MRTADHMNLSRYIMDHMDAGASKLKKAAFIFGSIEPDINMLTYFRGSIHGEEKLRGHNYENVQKYMEKLTNKLTKKLEKGGITTWQIHSHIRTTVYFLGILENTASTRQSCMTM